MATSRSITAKTAAAIATKSITTTTSKKTQKANYIFFERLYLNYFFLFTPSTQMSFIIAPI